jgi:hypothetical protein
LAGADPDILEKMTGIKERRFWEKGTTGVQVGSSHTTLSHAYAQVRGNAYGAVLVPAWRTEWVCARYGLVSYSLIGHCLAPPSAGDGLASSISSVFC